MLCRLNLDDVQECTVQVALEDFEGKIHRRKYGQIPINSQCRNRCNCAMNELYKGIHMENTY